MLKNNRVGSLLTVLSSTFIVSGILGYSLTYQHIPPLWNCACSGQMVSRSHLMLFEPKFGASVLGCVIGDVTTAQIWKEDR